VKGSAEEGRRVGRRENEDRETVRANMVDLES
jgi:hypothetical protein